MVDYIISIIHVYYLPSFTAYRSPLLFIGCLLLFIYFHPRPYDIIGTKLARIAPVVLAAKSNPVTTPVSSTVFLQQLYNNR